MIGPYFDKNPSRGYCIHWCCLVSDEYVEIFLGKSGLFTGQVKLEQLEYLRSEIPILVIHIRSHVIKRQSQSYKFQEFAKNSNIGILQKPLHATQLLKLLYMMCKYEMDPTSIVEDTEWTRFCPQMDRRTVGRTDGWRETSIPPFELRWSGGYNYCLTCTSKICLPTLVTNVIKYRILQKAPFQSDYTTMVNSMTCFIKTLSRWR